VGADHPDFRLPSYSLAGLMLLTSEPGEAERLLGEAFATGNDPAEERFVATYLFTRLELSIAEGITAELPVNRDAVGLALAELKQDEGDLADAIELDPILGSPVTRGKGRTASRAPDQGSIAAFQDSSEGESTAQGSSGSASSPLAGEAPLALVPPCPPAG
jgi:hypothetical protein